MEHDGFALPRRDVIKGLVAGAGLWVWGTGPMTESSMSRGLERCAPHEAGVSASGILRFLDAVEEKVGGLHSFMLLRRGRVAAEAWWRPYGPRYPHMLFSLSKSFTATAIGMAVAEGRLRVTDRVLSFFPDEAPANPDGNLRAMEVRHLLTMTTGHAEDTLGRTVRATDRDWVRAFLSLPVEHQPGTHFVYNSGATYMLSAIVQKVTGKRLLDYLTPRLFRPLGIGGATWETCPKGINTGGWGLSIKTEDIARFGQLYLQRGQWQGKQLVPEHWVAEATSRQVPNGTDPNSDWAQGYGYQFWRCRHGAYRGDGAFGQYCIVMPDQDAVLAITSGISDMQAVLNAVWDYLLPAMEGRAQGDRATSAQLSHRLAQLEVPWPRGSRSSRTAERLHERTFAIETNSRGIESVAFSVLPDRIFLTLKDQRGVHPIPCGLRGWVRAETALEPGPPARVAGRGAWTGEDTLTITLCFYETPFVRTVTAQIAGDAIRLSWKDNVGFGPTEGPTLTGRLVQAGVAPERSSVL